MSQSRLALLILNIVFAPWAMAADANCAKTLIEASIPGAVGEVTWESIANPDLSDAHPTTYAYLIHALPTRANLQNILKAQQENGSNISAAVDLVTNPELLSTKPRISTSFITEKAHRTFEQRGFGYIIKAPRSTIVGSATKDMGSSGSVGSGTMDELYNYISNKYPLVNPDQLTADPTKMNEVLLRGTSATGEKVEIAGIWAFSNGQGIVNLKPNEVEDFNFIRQKLKLPVIYLNEGDKSAFRMRMNSN